MVTIVHKNVAEVDTGTLAALTPVLLQTLYSDVTKNFILKNLRTIVHASIPNVGDQAMLVLADSDATLTEVSAALATTAFDPEDNTVFRAGQDTVRRVWDVQPLLFEGAAADSASYLIQWKLPPKGIPSLRGSGLIIYCFNFNIASAFANGPTFNLFTKFMGEFF